MHSDWSTRAEAELEAGRNSEKDGLKGRARVLARRAAGIAARYYLYGLDAPPAGNNFFLALTEFAQRPGLPTSIRSSAERLLLRVNPEHELPGDIDLLKEACQLIQFVREHSDDAKVEGS